VLGQNRTKRRTGLHHDPERLSRPDARLLVRPYDLDIHPRANVTPSIGARVKRIQSAGAQVRVELELEAETGELIQVEMTHSRSREMGRRTDEQVYCTPRDAKLFLGEGI